MVDLNLPQRPKEVDADANGNGGLSGIGGTLHAGCPTVWGCGD